MGRAGLAGPARPSPGPAHKRRPMTSPGKYENMSTAVLRDPELNLNPSVVVVLLMSEQGNIIGTRYIQT